MSKKILKEEKLLLQQIAEGDENAFAQIFHSYSNRLFAFIFTLSGSKPIAEDVVQDVFMKIWSNRNQLSKIENFHAYVFRMAHNHAINLLKRWSKERLVNVGGRGQPSFFSMPDKQLTFKNIEIALQQLVENLPPRQKEVYRLKREKGLKHEEIAQQLQISPSTVKNHLTQALHTIQKGLKQYYMDLLMVGIFVFLLL